MKMALSGTAPRFRIDAEETPANSSFLKLPAGMTADSLLRPLLVLTGGLRASQPDLHLLRYRYRRRLRTELLFPLTSNHILSLQLPTFDTDMHANQCGSSLIRQGEYHGQSRVSST